LKIEFDDTLNITPRGPLRKIMERVHSLAVEELGMTDETTLPNRVLVGVKHDSEMGATLGSTSILQMDPARILLRATRPSKMLWAYVFELVHLSHVKNEGLRVLFKKRGDPVSGIRFRGDTYTESALAIFSTTPNGLEDVPWNKVHDRAVEVFLRVLLRLSEEERMMIVNLSLIEMINTADNLEHEDPWLNPIPSEDLIG
jgi:hypothetical protein